MPVDLAPVTTLDDLRSFWAIEAAAQEHDYVALPADPIEELVPLLGGRPRAGEHVLLHLAREQGEPVGTLTLTLPLLDNLDVVHVDGQVHPPHRRRGYGRELLELAVRQVRRHRRSRVFVEAHSPLDGSQGRADALLRDLGFRPVLEEHRRLLDLEQHPVGTSADPPAGYRVEQWVDRCPDALVEGAARLAGRMTLDAPLGEMDYAPEVWDVGRYRDKEADAVARGRVRLATAVVHEASGAVAGVSDLGVNRGRPEVAYQWDTIVDPPHRGHRLGMALKEHNHALLVRELPGVRWVNTWNATTNTHMLTVNDALGFTPMERWWEWQLDL